MDAGLLWTAAGSAAGILAAVLIAWQVRLQLIERREPHRHHPATGKPSVSGDGGLPVAVPLGRLPAEVRGRDTLLAELRRPLTRRPRRPGGTWVLAGMGGLGKSTVALATAETARAKGWQVWWVTATDTASLTGGMLEVLRQLGAPESVTQPVREGAPTAAERTWALLNGPHQAGRRWLLILDNADAPAVLAAHGTASPADHAGWLRPDPSGMVIVTTRVKDPRAWGSRVTLRELKPLDDATAARVLTDLAPGIPDPAAAQARELARRLGGLPLALYLAGSYLASPFARWNSFAAYRGALDSTGLPGALADLDNPAAQARATIQRTWDLSLDALAADGVPQARPLLLLLSCYAPATPIPATLLQPEPLTHLLTQDGHPPADPVRDIDAERERRLRTTLHSLATVGLIDIADSNDPISTRAITVHPVVADANRTRLLTTARADLPAIGRAALGLLQAVGGELDYRHPADWPAWRQIIPHVTALLDWLAAHLDADSLASLLTLSDPAADALWRSGNLAAAEELARSSVTVATRLGEEHPAMLAVRHTLAAVIAGRGGYREAEGLYLQLLTDQGRVLGEDHAATLKTRHRLAWSIGEQGRYAEAEQRLRQVLTDRQRVLGEDHTATLATRHKLAQALTDQGKYKEAERMLWQVLSDRQRIFGEEHPYTLATGHALARVLSLEGQYGESEQLYRKVLSDRQRILGDDHPHTLETRHRIARAIAGQGRYAEAERMLWQVLSDRQRVLGDEHPDTLTTRQRLAQVTAAQGRYEEAEQRLRQVLGVQQRIIGEHHPGTLSTRHGLTRVIAELGRYEEAEQLCHQALAGRRKILGDHHPYTLSTRHTLARVTAAQGRYEDAEQLLRRILADRERVLGEEHPDTLTTRQCLAWVIALQGRYEEAEQLYRQALGDRQRVLGNDHPDTVTTRNDLARMIALRGKTVG